MSQIIIQYVLVVLLVLGLGYVLYLLKDKGVSIKEDYFGIASTVLSSIQGNKATPENIKKILRIISTAVNYVEENHTDEENYVKEDKALSMVKEALSELNFTSKIDDDSLRNIIRLCCAFLPPTEKIL